LGSAGRLIHNQQKICLTFRQSTIDIQLFLRNETDAIHFNSISGIKIFRPLSKTVRFNVLKVIPAGSTGGGGKKAFAAV
jgi:hypothetical protein